MGEQMTQLTAALQELSTDITRQNGLIGQLAIQVQAQIDAGNIDDPQVGVLLQQVIDMNANLDNNSNQLAANITNLENN